MKPIKTIKKYTRYSLPLFVELVSLQALSACSHRKQKLGIGGFISSGINSSGLVPNGTPGSTPGPINITTLPPFNNLTTAEEIIAITNLTEEAFLSTLFPTGSPTTTTEQPSPSTLDSIKQEELNNLLLKAVKYGNLEDAKRWIQEGADVNVQNKYGATPLIRAAFYGYKTIVELLLAKDADGSVQDKYNGDTALIQAERNRDTAIVKRLLDKG